MLLFIGNLNRLATEKDLKTLLLNYSDIFRFRIMVDKITRRSRGFAYVEIKEESGNRLISELNSTVFMDSYLIVGEVTVNQRHAIEW